MSGSVGPSGVHPAFFVLSWVFFSNLTILFNKWLIDSVGFRYPVILTCWHMMFATAATQLLARTTRMLDSRHAVHMNRRAYVRAVVPIGVLYSASMVCSTLVYLYLSVPFIQMLKAAAPAVVLFIGWLWGVESPTFGTVLNIAGIVAGVAVASAGEIHFSWAGFLYQLGGIVFESLRVVMIQALFARGSDGGGDGNNDDDDNNSNSNSGSAGEVANYSNKPAPAFPSVVRNEQDDKGQPLTAKAAQEDKIQPARKPSPQTPPPVQLHKMDPLVGLYYYAPVCAVANLALAVLWEGRSFRWQHVVDAGPAVLALNALVAFLLNVSSVLLIGKTSGLVLVLTGILKNILLVASAVAFTGEHMTALQALGYGAALLGLVVYQARWVDLPRVWRLPESLSSFMSPLSLAGRRIMRTRRLLVAAVFCAASVCLLYTVLTAATAGPAGPSSSASLSSSSSSSSSSLPSRWAWLPAWLVARPAGHG